MDEAVLHFSTSEGEFAPGSANRNGFDLSKLPLSLRRIAQSWSQQFEDWNEKFADPNMWGTEPSISGKILYSALVACHAPNGRGAEWIELFNAGSGPNPRDEHYLLKSSQSSLPKGRSLFFNITSVDIAPTAKPFSETAHREWRRSHHSVPGAVKFEWGTLGTVHTFDIQAAEAMGQSPEKFGGGMTHRMWHQLEDTDKQDFAREAGQLLLPHAPLVITARRFGDFYRKLLRTEQIERVGPHTVRYTDKFPIEKRRGQTITFATKDEIRRFFPGYSLLYMKEGTELERMGGNKEHTPILTVVLRKPGTKEVPEPIVDDYAIASALGREFDRPSRGPNGDAARIHAAARQTQRRVANDFPRPIAA